MTDYISREATRPDAFCVGISCQECPFCKDNLNGGCRVDDFIMALPAADVAPVVHAEWKVTDAYPHRVYCGHCFLTYAQEQWTVWKDGTLPRKYCPNCGAIMDGGDQSE